MKKPPANLLAPWPDDRGSVRAPDEPRALSLLAALHQEAIGTLEWLAWTLQESKRNDDETLFDRLYRRGHVLHGMAGLLGLPKASHLLAILDFGLDLGRSLQTFERHSLGYVVDLLITTTRGVLEDLKTQGICDRDLTDVIEECQRYLGAPLSAATPAVSVEQKKPEVRSQESGVRGQESEVKSQGSEVRSQEPASLPTPDPCPLPPGPKVEIDDGPEELDIPADKMGLTSIFCEEGRSNLALAGRRLVELEEAAEPLPIVNDLFRSVHTVKGGARVFKIRKMELLAHHMESLLDRVRKGALGVSSSLIDALLDGRGLLEQMLDEVASRGPIRTSIAACMRALAALEHGQEAAPPAAKISASPETPTASPAPQKPVAKQERAIESIRVPTEKMDDVINTASEVLVGRIRLAGDVSALHGAIHDFKQTLQRTDPLAPEAILTRLSEHNRRLVGELQALVGAQGGRVPSEPLAALVNRFHQDLSAAAAQQRCSAADEMTLHLLAIDEVRKRMQKNVEHLERLSTRLQSEAMSFRMVPISQLFDRFHTQVRDIARQLEKKVRLEVNGGDTELDKVLIDQLADPLLHLLRNSLDHGIEAPEVREGQGKPKVGTITLRAYYHGSHAVIEVRDDGKGIDVERVRAKAIENGLVDATRAATLTPGEIFAFIFEPGFSTANQVSMLSGRGVGMDVVQTTISQVQGSISIESAPGQGTIIRMKLPLTLAVVGILLVREGAQQLALPIQHIEEILTVRLSEIRHFGDHATCNHRGSTLPVTTLSSLLGFPASKVAEEASLVILADGDRKVAVLVDAVLGRQEVLIRNLGSLIKKAPFVMGCTILSDSRLVLILNAWDIVHSRFTRPPAVAQEAASQKQVQRKGHSVLIVDDSASQRSHLGSVLTQAGYAVDTADNGFEALKRMRQRRHSAFCVDVVMPLMDGFELVERLRRAPGSSDLPVLFVTGRCSQPERDRAAQLGVAHYFEKPVDPQTLIEAIDASVLGPAV
jgi:two-component system chemotaxis sensor kinase CheA